MNRLAAGILTALTVVACAPGPSRHERRDADAGAASQAPRVTEAKTGAGGASPPSLGKPNDQLLREAVATRKPPAPAPRVPEDAAPVDMVTIHVLVEPPQRAHVIWGAKDFGLGPLDIRRPRGSGPLELLVRAPGYLTLHTRAFTERDSTLSVHLVPEAEASRFPGYQAPAATVTTRGTAATNSQKTTTRAMRPGKPSDGVRAP